MGFAVAAVAALPNPAVARSATTGIHWYVIIIINFLLVNCYAYQLFSFSSFAARASFTFSTSLAASWSSSMVVRHPVCQSREVPPLRRDRFCFGGKFSFSIGGREPRRTLHRLLARLLNSGSLRRVLKSSDPIISSTRSLLSHDASRADTQRTYR